MVSLPNNGGKRIRSCRRTFLAEFRKGIRKGIRRVAQTAS